MQIPVVLPGVPDEKDACVTRLIHRMEQQEAIQKAHVAEGKDGQGPQLCFHYDPGVISMDRIRSIAQQEGEDLTRDFGHLLVGVEGVRHTRHARQIERRLRRHGGLLDVSVSASGPVRIEFDKTVTSVAAVRQLLRDEGLMVTDEETADTQKTTLAESADHVHKEGDGHDHDEDEAHEHSEGDGHDHGGFLGKNTELYFSLICGALLGVGFGLSYVDSVPAWVSLALYVGAYGFGGYFTAKEAVETIRAGGFEIDFLMLVAAIGAAILGEWAEGALLLFLFSLGHALENYAMGRARKSIADLADLAPKTALLKKDGRTEEVGIETLAVGDIIVVKPNSKISADGVVVDGSSSVNQAPITGESVPVDKTAVADPAKEYTAQDDIKDENGPKWEFVDRPLSSTRIIPSTFSNVGFGLYGKKYTRNWVFAYECYLTNGFDNSIIANTQNRTFLPAAKVNPNRFEESFNGVPLVTLKAAVKRRKFGEIGLSWMGGVYNKFRDDGLVLDQRRRVDVWAVDFNTVLPGSRTYLNGEFVWARVDVPSTYSQQFGRRQQGGWLDVVQPVLRGRMLGWNTATLNVAARLERVDYNVGTFNETNENIYDEIWSVVPAISFRPSPTTVIRANYRYQWDTDILGNPPARTAIFQVGFSTYF